LILRTGEITADTSDAVKNRFFSDFYPLVNRDRVLTLDHLRLLRDAWASPEFAVTDSLPVLQQRTSLVQFHITLCSIRSAEVWDMDRVKEKGRFLICHLAQWCRTETLTGG
jgi:hypothetical protein